MIAQVGSALPLLCEQIGASDLAWPLPAQTTTLEFGESTEGALFEIEERGVELVLREVAGIGEDQAQAEAIEIGARPLRLGMLVAPAQPGRRIEIAPRGPDNPQVEAGMLRLHCRPDAELLATAECLESAARTISASDAEMARTRLPPRCAATAAHSAAIARYREGRLDEAERLYQIAIDRWQQIDDPLRAAGAELGLAEALSRQSRHLEALEGAERAVTLAEMTRVPYFVTRSTYQRCLILRYLGRLSRATACLEPLPRRYLEFGETSEAANALVMLARWARHEERPERAKQVLAQVEALPAERVSPLVRARVADNRAALEAEAGRVHIALALHESALTRFERVPSLPDVAFTYLTTSQLHAALGADAEAALLASSAAETFARVQMPAQQAGAILIRARIEAERGEVAQALASLAQAEALTDAKQNPYLHVHLALLGWRLQPTAERWARIEALVAGDFELTQRLQFDLASARARAALAKNEPRLAIAELTAHEAGAGDLARRITFEQLFAQAETQSGAAHAARARLDAMIEGIRTIAAQVRAPALRQIAGRRLLELRSAWIDTLDTEDFDAELGATITRMLLATDPGGLLHPHDTAAAQPTTAEGDPDGLDRILARILIESGSEQSDLLAAQRAIWAGYGSTSVAAPTLLEWSEDEWHRVQQQLHSDDALLLVGLGQRQSVAAIVRQAGLDAYRLAGARTILERANRLADLTARRDTPIVQIEEAAMALANELLPSQAGAAPLRLRLLVDESLVKVPFVLLRWPGQAGPLIETTTVSLVSSTPGLSIDQELESESDEPDIEVLIAAQPIATERGGLPRLLNAEIEHGLIADSMPHRTVARSPLSAERLRDALTRPKSWIHVAGHGDAHGGLQGYTGLWADPEEDDPDGLPRFISWLDLIEQPVLAHLVVLNACTLAGTGADYVNRSSSFAAAIQAAGATHVVAALWPVSDGAAGIWVPAFYRQLPLASTPSRGDPAAAMREAQLTLRNSRAFRHPFFWASLVHFTHL